MKRLITLLLILAPVALLAQDTLVYPPVKAKIIGSYDILGYNTTSNKIDSFFAANYINQDSLHGLNESRHLLDIAFIVDTSGKITYGWLISATRDEHRYIAKEAMRLFELLRDEFKWEPARVANRKVCQKIFYRFEVNNGNYVYDEHFLPPIPLSLLPLPKFSPFNDISIEEYERIPTKYPEFKNGVIELDSFLKASFVMPAKAKRVEAEGQIHVELLISKSGEVEDIAVVRDAVGWGCAEELYRLIIILAEQYTWNPAEDNEKKIMGIYRIKVFISKYNIDLLID